MRLMSSMMIKRARCVWSETVRYEQEHGGNDIVVGGCYKASECFQSGTTELKH